MTESHSIRRRRSHLVAAHVVAAILVLGFGAGLQPVSGASERIRLDDGWRFALGHATDPLMDFGHATGYFSYLAKTGFGDGPASAAFDDRGWRIVCLPHDWAVEAPFDSEASHSHGYKAVGPGFPASSVGWYRKTVFIPEEDLGRRISVEFDGVFRDANVFVNGFFVGNEPSGYLNHAYDVTDYLNYGGENFVVVRVDASMEEGWFYEGAGVYRHVWLLKTDPLHLVRDGIWVRSTVADGRATLAIQSEIRNDADAAKSAQVRHALRDASGNVVATRTRDPGDFAPGATALIEDILEIAEPTLWSLENPYLYALETELIDAAGAVVDTITTNVGIRTIRFDPDHGFFLNGQHVKLKGTNNHQDHAGVGAAIPDALQEWRIRRLQEMGSNAYRTAHNPPTPELLDACDRLGMLVINETRLMGINDYHLGQLERLMRRDRNHPSVILWGLGNEEWAIEGNIKGERITQTMQNFARRIDPTRPLTVAISGGWGGISRVVEVLGVNYIRHGDTDRQHAEFPWQIIVGTEETTTQQTRGIYFEDPERCHLPPLDDGSTGGNAETGWRHYAGRDYAAGVFYWTGFDYRGEPTPYAFPAISSQFGILDTCGFPKDSFYFLKSWWTDEPVLHVFPHWNWPDRVGEILPVRVHSNYATVELFLNGTSLGRKDMPHNGHLEWQVTYAPGELLAVGRDAEGREHRTVVRTTGPASAVALETDSTALTAGARDIAVVTISIRDDGGLVVPTAEDLVRLDLQGPGRIIGVGNGNPSSHEPDVFVETVSSERIGDWTAPEPSDAETPIRWEVAFDRPEVDDGTAVELMLNVLGENQQVRLNDELLDLGLGRPSLPLDLATLRPTGNHLRIDAIPFPVWRDREALVQFHPASLRFEQAAPPWQRRAFNGLAQVIIESDGESGELVLTATREGMKPATLRLHVGE